MNRRTFLQRSGVIGAMAATGSLPLSAMSSSEIVRVTILHTNDVHSRIDPFPMDGSRNAGKGGVARRAKMIAAVRATEKNVLLFDSGDIFQGTPYFNVFGGEVEFKLMSAMGYDAATIGNHDFDAGIEGLVKQLPHARFPFVISNYNMEDTPMQGSYSSKKVFDVEGVRIGVFGLGIELEGLVPRTLYGETQYLAPVAKGQKMATFLKEELACDFVVCLSHLGYRYRDRTISDVRLAASTRHVDLILGGHTHTFMDEPSIIPNLDDVPVYINQAGWGGMRMGRIDLYFEKEGNRRNCFTCNNLWVQP